MVYSEQQRNTIQFHFVVLNYHIIKTREKIYQNISKFIIILNNTSSHISKEVIQYVEKNINISIDYFPYLPFL